MQSSARRVGTRLTTTLALLLTIALFSGCKSAPAPSPPPAPPDLDGKAEGARDLEIGIRHRDLLDCVAGDCADWYRVHAPVGGRLRADAYVQTGDEASPYEVLLRDAHNEPLATAERISQGQRGLEVQVESGDYLIGVEAGKGTGQMRYEIAVYFQGVVRRPPIEPEPESERKVQPPPAPRYEIVKAEVLEVEGGTSNPDSVLISQGDGAGIRVGMRGRLLVNGNSIGGIEIVDTYPDGSRARIEGVLHSPITADTLVEIDVPIVSGDGAEPQDSDASTSRSF